MKRFQILPIVSLVGSQFISPMSVEAQTDKPNVLLIIIDDMNDYTSLLSSYPGLKTPNLEKFAKTATTFTRAYCAAPVSNPSRAAVLSGMGPYTTGVYDNNYLIQDSPIIMKSEFLPEHFKANGYTTLTRGKVFHTNPGKNRFDNMWDDDAGKGNYGPTPKERHFPEALKKPGSFEYQPWEGPESDHPDNITAEVTIERLQENYDKPFFIACGFYKPHNPWTAPQRFFDMYPLETLQMPPVLENDCDDLPAIAKSWAEGPVDFEDVKTSGEWAPVVRSYLACISFLDYNFGRVIEALDNSKYRDNTIVVVMADNGFHMGEKKHFTKYALWEKTTHELLMWRVPGITKPNTVCQRTVNLMDIYPTLNELCKLSSPVQNLDGRSIVPLIKNPALKWDYPSVTTYLKDNYSVRNEQFRYIQYNDGTSELYDHSSDENEYFNLMYSNPEEYQDVINELVKWIPMHSVTGVTNPSLNPYGMKQ